MAAQVRGYENNASLKWIDQWIGQGVTLHMIDEVEFSTILSLGKLLSLDETSYSRYSCGHISDWANSTPI